MTASNTATTTAAAAATTLQEYAAAWRDSVTPSRHPDASRSDNVLVAARNFEPGDVIFTELALFNSRHPVCRQFTPVDIQIAADFQRLLYEFIHHRLYPSDRTVLHAMVLQSMSTDGMTSALAQEANAERIERYKEQLPIFRKRIQTRLKNRKSNKPDGSLPSVAELQTLLNIIETNVHARSRFSAQPSDPISSFGILLDSPPTRASAGNAVDDDSDDDDEEDDLQLAPLASLPEHSCYANAVLRVDDSPPSSALSTVSGDGATWLTFLATRPIAAGQVISIPYRDMFGLPTSARQERLLTRGFRCQCKLCTRPDDVMRPGRCAKCFSIVFPSHNETVQAKCTCGQLKPKASKLKQQETRLAQDLESAVACVQLILQRFDSVLSGNVPQAPLPLLLGTLARLDSDAQVRKYLPNYVSVRSYSLARIPERLLFANSEAFYDMFSVRMVRPALAYLLAVAYASCGDVAGLDAASSTEADWAGVVFGRPDIQHNLMELLCFPELGGLAALPKTTQCLVLWAGRQLASFHCTFPQHTKPATAAADTQSPFKRANGIAASLGQPLLPDHLSQ